MQDEEAVNQFDEVHHVSYVCFNIIILTLCCMNCVFRWFLRFDPRQTHRSGAHRKFFP